MYTKLGSGRSGSGSGAAQRANLQREAAGFLQSWTGHGQATGLLLHFSYPIWIKQKEGEVDGGGLAPWSMAMDQATTMGTRAAASLAWHCSPRS